MLVYFADSVICAEFPTVIVESSLKHVLVKCNLCLPAFQKEVSLGAFEQITFVKSVTSVGHHLSKFIALWGEQLSGLRELYMNFT